MRLPGGLLLVWLIVLSLGGRIAASMAADPTGRESEISAANAKQSDERQRQIDQLIEQLGDKDFAVRQHAQEELAKYEAEAFDALTAAAQRDDLEIAARARALLRVMRMDWTEKNDPPEVKKILADYEGKNDAVKLSRMRSLAELPDGAGVAALCRLVRFEKSTILSKQAAIQVFAGPFGDEPPSKEVADVIRKNLAGNARPGAKWLIAWSQFSDNPSAAATDWIKLVEAERSLQKAAPKETSPEILAALMRVEVLRLKQLGRMDDAAAALRRLVDIVPGNQETLTELLDWLMEQKDWKTVDEVWTRFQPSIEENAALLYIMAQTFDLRGDKQRAEKLASDAFKLNPGKELYQLDLHRYPTAYQLRRRGLFSWAERELRYVVINTPDTAEASELKTSARTGIVEIYRDQKKYQDAAAELEDAIETTNKFPSNNASTRHTVAELESTMHYLLSCHYETLRDATKQKEQLALAIAGDQPDLDAVITCYRMPGQSPEETKNIRGLIRRLSARMENEIRNNPSSSSAYNQYAWLIGNTEGDLDLALNFSKKSIELSPNSGGLYDTLAHVYYTKGDYEEAVKIQTKACKLEPNSRLLLEPLALFREKLSQRKREAQSVKP
jgi:tetratricopeptide (TPR) repeat protein